MKTAMDHPKFRPTAEFPKNTPSKEKRLDAKMIVMIEESINRCFCQLQKVQKEKR